jgi:hypothetical protein
MTLWTDCFDNLSKYAKFTTLDDINYAVYVSLKHKYVFVETAKVACSTVKMTLQRLELEDKNFTREVFQDVHNRAYSPLLRLQQVPNFERVLKSDNYFRFCFVRNPYTRTLSAYLNKILGNSLPEKSIILSQLGLDMRDMSIPISFEQFISAIEKQPISMMNNHWRHQYYSTYQDTMNYHFIGKFERFDEDFSYVMEKLGASSYYLSESRHATNSTSKFNEYYTDELLERVYELYQIDFKTFDYDKKPF